jgi:hypothetical protein
MKSNSIVVATFVLVAVSASQISLRAGAQATSDSGAVPKTELAMSASASTGASQSSAAGILPPKVNMPAVASTGPLVPGIHLVAEFENTLKAKKLKPGDKVKAMLTQDLILHGKVIAPSESKILGHVTEAKGATDSDPQSRLGIVFDKILLKHHEELNFFGVVQALAPPGPRHSKVDEPSQMLPPQLMGGGSGQGPSPVQPPGGRTGSSNRTTSNNTSSSVNSASSSMASLPVSAPIRVKGNPGGSVGDGSAVEAQAGAKPISAGLPQGVFGLRGLTLSATPSADTPGPVILSNSGSIVLEYGTQVLLRVAAPIVPTH